MCSYPVGTLIDKIKNIANSHFPEGVYFTGLSTTWTNGLRGNTGLIELYMPDHILYLNLNYFIYYDTVLKKIHIPRNLVEWTGYQTLLFNAKPSVPIDFPESCKKLNFKSSSDKSVSKCDVILRSQTLVDVQPSSYTNIFANDVNIYVPSVLIDSYKALKPFANRNVYAIEGSKYENVIY